MQKITYMVICRKGWSGFFFAQARGIANSGVWHGHQILVQKQLCSGVNNSVTVYAIGVVQIIQVAGLAKPVRSQWTDSHPPDSAEP